MKDFLVMSREKQPKPMPYHNEPTKQSAWYIWVLLAVLACGVVSFSIFAPSFGLKGEDSSLNASQQDPVNQTTTSKAPLVEETFAETVVESEQKVDEQVYISQIETMQKEFSTALSQVHNTLKTLENKNVQAEEKLKTLGTTLQTLDTTATVETKTVIKPIAENPVWVTLMELKEHGMLDTSSVLRFADTILNEQKSNALQTYANILKEKNTTYEAVIFAYFDVLQQGAPKKPNMIAYDDVEQTWKDKASKLLAKFVYISKEDGLSKHTLTWQEAMQEIKADLQMYNAIKALEKLNKAPLISDARLDGLREIMARFIAEESTWKSIFRNTETPVVEAE